jgi:hypothetical protein
MSYLNYKIERYYRNMKGYFDLCETTLSMMETHYFLHGGLNTEVIEQNANEAS